jgi:3-phosphoshikimate 1-carboxyvinyltransferase
MKGLIDALRSLGADIRCTGAEGFFPLEIHARGLRGGTVEIDASESSQMLSALLMVAPLADEPVEPRAVGGVRLPFVQMTMTIMQAFQRGLERNVTQLDEQRFRVAKTSYSMTGVFHTIEPDATAASYFMALPLAVTRHGALCLRGFHVNHRSRSLQGDVRFTDVVEELGCEVISKPIGTEIMFSGNVRKVGGLPRAYEFQGFSDTFLTLAAIAPLLDGPTKITGIAHTRKQETDRIAGMAHELRKLGQEVVETEDTLTITPRPLTPGVEIETYGDHRFAMSFAILGCHDLLGNGEPWLAIKNPACCAKTFPNFFDVLAKVWKDSHPA